MINDPVNFPPETINGIMTTGFLTPPGSSNWIYPKALQREINAAAGGYECDIPLDFPEIAANDREAAIALLEKLSSKVFRVSKYAASKFDWDVLAVFFTTTDRMQHFWWNDPEITRHYQFLDRMLGDYVKMANEASADLIVVSDHGFGPLNRTFHVNEWLEQRGLAKYRKHLLSAFLSRIGLTKSKITRSWGPRPPIFTGLPVSLQEIITRTLPQTNQSLRELDVAESAAFARTSSGIYLQRKDLRYYLLNELPQIRDKFHEPIFERVVDRDEALNGPYSYRAPDLFLQPHIGWGVSHSKNGDAHSKWTGTHRTEGIFVHYRPQSSPLMPVSGPIRPWDVAAIVLRAVDIPIPSYFEGEAPAYFA